jgi:hypothetical protein
MSRAVTAKLRACELVRNGDFSALIATSRQLQRARSALDVTRRDRTIASGSHDPDRGDADSMVRPSGQESRALTPLNGCDHRPTGNEFLEGTRRLGNCVRVTDTERSVRIDSYHPSETPKVRPVGQRHAAATCLLASPHSARTEPVRSKILGRFVAGSMSRERTNLSMHLLEHCRVHESLALCTGSRSRCDGGMRGVRRRRTTRSCHVD